MKVSIIMPVFNSEKYVSKSIDSIMNQTYDHWELIIVNDGSSDDTEVICREYSECDNRIKLINIKNSGPSVARNIGLQNSKGNYILFLDGDDYFENNALEVLSNELIDKKYDIIFFGNYLDIYENRTYNILNNNIIEEITVNNNEDFKKIYSVLLDNYYVNQVWNKIYSRDFIEMVGARFPIGINYSEDLIFNIELYKKVNDVKVINKALYHYVNHKGDSLCSTFQKNKFYYVKFVYRTISKELMCWNPAVSNKFDNLFIKDINIVINSLFNKDCNLKLREKYIFINNIISDDIVKQCVNTAKCIGIRNKITSTLIKLRLSYILLLIGKLTRIIKKV